MLKNKMRNQKYQKYQKFISAAVMFFLPGLILAIHIGGVPHATAQATIDISGILNRTINWGFGLILALAAAFIVYAAFLYLTSAGEPEKIKAAGNYILYAVIAIVVAFSARGIVRITNYFLTGI